MNNHIKLLFSGDFCPIGRSEDFINKFSVNDAFGDILPIIRESDIAITNLECPLVESGIPITKTGPSLRSIVKTAEFLKSSGFSLVTLANNHIMDYGKSGLVSTMNACENAGLKYVGAGLSSVEARRILYFEISDIKMAFINICENEWSTTNGTYPGANPLNTITNHYDIKNAKANATYVFVILHGNNEMYHLPSPRIKELCHYYIDSGACFVICHHSHVFSGYESYNNGVIFYGLGNFLFDDPRLRNHSWNNGLLVQIDLCEKDSKFNIIPTRQSDVNPGVRLAVNNYFNEFVARINEINQIILDDNRLEEEFRKFCYRRNVYKTYTSYLEPYSNKYLVGLFKRNLLPSILSKSKKMLLDNLFRCESHRDVIQIILNK